MRISAREGVFKLLNEFISDLENKRNKKKTPKYTVKVAEKVVLSTQKIQFQFHDLT